MLGSSTNVGADFLSQSNSPLDPGAQSTVALIPSDPFRNPSDSTLSSYSSYYPASLNANTLSEAQVAPTSTFTSGWFTVGSTGQVGIDYLYDGGSYQGDVGIFSLEGLDEFVPGSTEFIQAVVQRVLSNSTLGHLIISDKNEGARFESYFNAGDYLGVKTVGMNAGDRFGMVLVPNGTFYELAQDPTLNGSQRPLFSLSIANPIEAFQFGQIADVTGNGSTFVFEDLRLDGTSDRDYEDIVLQVRGAIGFAAELDEVINPGNEWRNSTMGQAILNYIAPYDNSIDSQSGNYQSPKSNQPLIGIIDTGFAANNPDIDYSRIILGRDYVDGDNNPLLVPGEGNEHGTHILGIIGATQNNGIGIDGINDQAPLWLGRAIGSGKWAESLVEFVDVSKRAGQQNAVVNLSFDLTQKNSDGSVKTRYEFTSQERQALEYARQNGVLIVAAAGNDGGTMSALGQASQEFDNIITVGSIDYNNKRADYSSFGYGLDLVAYGGTLEKPVISTMGNATDLKRLVEDLGLQWDGIAGDLKNQNVANQQVATSNEAGRLPNTAENESSKSVTKWALFDEGSAETSNEVDENLLSDEMAANAHQVFVDVFGELSDADESELENLTPEERQIYEEATQEIDQFLSDYLEAASQKLVLEYVDGYYETQVEALSQFVDAFDENVAETLLKAQELLQEAGFSIELPQEASKDTPLDLGLGGMVGTSTAAATVTGVVSRVWAANPNLSYAQIKDILKRTATDLNTPGWDKETGAGKVNLAGSISLAKTTHPETYQPQPIISPLIWSGEGTLSLGERPVWYSVPSFTGRIMNAGYVNQVGFLRIRSGPGTGFSEVGRLSPDTTVIFDAVEDQGGWVPDPFMPGGGSGRWYRIAGTNNWMSGLYFDNSPEQAAQERQRQEAIRLAEEEARRAEEEVRRAEEEARQAEEELSRLEAEQRRIQEEQRLRQAAFQALVNGITQQYGDPGLLMGSWISNGVTVYQFAKGQLLIQPDGRFTFYEQVKNVYNSEQAKFIKDYVWGAPNALDFARKDIFNDIFGREWAAANDVINGFINSHVVNPKGFWRSLDAIYPVTKFFPADTVLRTAAHTREFFVNGAGTKIMRGLTSVGDLLNYPILKKVGSNIPVAGDVIDLGLLATDLTIGDDKTKRRALLKGGTMALAGVVGAGVGALGFGAGAVPVGIGAALAAGAMMDIVYLGFDLTGNGDKLDGAIENSFNAVSSAYNSTLEAARQKAAQAKQLAQQAVDKAKVTFQAAKETVQQAQKVYQTFKKEVQQRTTQVVQQAEQKMREVAQSVMQKVANNPIVQAGSRIINQVGNYAKKAFNAVNTVINGAKQFVNNVIQTGKQIVNDIVETGKQAYQQVSNFVSEKVEQGKQFAADTYNKVSQAASTVTNFVSDGFNSMRSMFGG